MPEPTTHRKTARAPWGGLSREQVVLTAERVVRTDGFEQLTIRRLANELDVAPMALYRHVRDKDDLLDEVVDRMLARRWRPRSSQDDWSAWMTEAARRMRSFLVSEPAAMHVYLRHPVVQPSAIARMEATLQVLSDAGFDAESANKAFAAVHTYTIGFAALEASRARHYRRNSERPQELRDLEQRLSSFTSDAQFDVGLAYLLDGIARSRYARSPE